MKKTILKIAFISATILMSSESFAGQLTVKNQMEIKGKTTTETFKVYGNCGMCEKKIEGALTNVKGISKADWDKETKMMVVEFDKSKITLDEIKKKIAAVGYDTEEYKSTTKAYESLPGCCQYERPESKMDMKKDEDHKGHHH